MPVVAVKHSTSGHIIVECALAIKYFLQKLAAYQARVGIHRSLKGLLSETWCLSA
jgi:hypothetical protein